MGLPLLGALPLDRARAVLDLGAGVGALFPHLRANAPQARLTGTDISIGMLRRTSPNEEAWLAVMDAQALGFVDASFDTAILMFMLFHVPDPATALSEVARVTRPGGMVGITTWSDSPPLPGYPVWELELERAGLPPDSRDPLTRQQELVGDANALAAMLTTAGLDVADQWEESFTHEWDPEELLTLHQSCGIPRRRLAAVPPRTRALCVERIRSSLDGLAEEDLMWRPTVLFTVARC